MFRIESNSNGISKFAELGFPFTLDGSDNAPAFYYNEEDLILKIEENTVSGSLNIV